jgi:hypothetical protein
MQGKDKCGFKGIRANQVDENSSVFEMHEVNARNLRSDRDENHENSGTNRTPEQLGTTNCAFFFSIFE